MTISPPAARRGSLSFPATVAALLARVRTRRRRSPGRAVALAVSLLFVVGLAWSGPVRPAYAAPPTRVVDRTAFVVCEAVHQDLEITVRATRSDLTGTQSAVRLSSPSTGAVIGYGSSVSDWGDGTVRAAVPVLDGDDQPTGEEVYFSAVYAVAGPTQVTQDRFNVGNVHVVEEHRETPWRVSDVTLSYAGITFAPTCAGSSADGSLFFTNPATMVEIGSSLAHECTGSNIGQDGWTVTGTLDDLFVDLVYADRPEALASGVVAVDGGTWQGELQLQISDEPAGSVDARATLERSGHPYHGTAGGTGMRDHFQVTPYHFTLAAEGPGAPAALDCTLFDVRQVLHYPNPTG